MLDSFNLYLFHIKNQPFVLFKFHSIYDCAIKKPQIFIILIKSADNFYFPYFKVCFQITIVKTLSS